MIRPQHHPFPTHLVAGFALAKLVVHLVSIQGYGYFRDELYYLACADHPSFGYVDHPPFSIWILWVVRLLIGDSTIAIRLVPALLGAATVALIGAMAHRMGAGRWGVTLAMSGGLAAPVFLALDHFYSMNAWDLFFWAAVGHLVLGLGGDEQPRPSRWALLGGVLGLGLLNKISILWLGAGLAMGILIARPRWLQTSGPWIAGGISMAMFSPYLIWQVTNDWPTREFIANATAQKMVSVSPLAFLSGQVEMMLVFVLPLWLAGLLWLLAAPAARHHRILGVAYLTVFAILMMAGSSRANYLAPAYTWLLAGGGVFWGSWLDRPRLTLLRPMAMVLILMGGAVAAPLALPILPVEQHVAWARALGQAPATEERKELGRLGQFFADMHGWPEIVDTVAGVYESLPDIERGEVRIFAPNYGIAGAVDVLGQRRGLPPAISGHNQYWLWGPRGWQGGTLIIVGGDRQDLEAIFDRVDEAAIIDCGLCMPYENGQAVWVARGLKPDLDAAWATTKHFE
ncbi:MAG: glycosyltransferase family 39 protein [Thermoanaerobaculia bacterium]|nr:glycosyltransferase family 39 protein [Thermoanaerobaculia bacterium]